ncbi:MAG: HAMP domain-containing protein [Acidobacteria bacterium]|nr:MAG: HAMP domain-containing protein [Acidobacteriota bacterium]
MRILSVMVLSIVVIELAVLVPMTLHFRRERRDHFYALAAAAAGRAAPSIAGALGDAARDPALIREVMPEGPGLRALYGAGGRLLWADPGWPRETAEEIVRRTDPAGGIAEGEHGGLCYVLYPLRAADGSLAGRLAIVESGSRLRRETVGYVLRVLGLVLLICLFTSVTVFVYLRRAVLRPIEAIVRANIASAGDPGAAELVPESLAARNELGEIIRTRNRMLESLRAAREEILRQNEQLERWNRMLERRVEERTEQLRAARERAVQAEKLAEIGRLAASVAHEVNNPLGIIAASAEDLRRHLAALPDRDAGAERPFQIILSQVERCRRIIDALLNFSRRTACEPERIEVGPFLARTVELVRRRAEREGKAIELAVDDGRARVLAMPTQLQQSLVNLLENALDASPPGAPVVVGARRRGTGTVEIYVCDRGPGMEPDVQRQIFEPFYTTKEPGRGAGMGLTIASQFVRAQGGTLTCESEPGRGSTFRIGLPAVEESDRGPEDSPADSR